MPAASSSSTSRSAAASPSPWPASSRRRSPWQWASCTTRASSTATSSPRTSSCARTATCTSSTWASARTASPPPPRAPPPFAAPPSTSPPRSCSCRTTASPWTGGPSAWCSTRCSPACPRGTRTRRTKCVKGSSTPSSPSQATCPWRPGTLFRACSTATRRSGSARARTSATCSCTPSLPALTGSRSSRAGSARLSARRRTAPPRTRSPATSTRASPPRAWMSRRTSRPPSPTTSSVTFTLTRSTPCRPAARPPWPADRSD
mmetsp:Transcript_4107/g.11907  ORF Transcript_4107/g.11907 Transcript_4107/m.11907 type:complete len:261 (-) Transcript_4107:132-914(-)